MSACLYIKHFTNWAFNHSFCLLVCLFVACPYKTKHGDSKEEVWYLCQWFKTLNKNKQPNKQITKTKQKEKVGGRHINLFNVSFIWPGSLQQKTNEWQKWVKLCSFSVSHCVCGDMSLDKWRRQSSSEGRRGEEKGICYHSSVSPAPSLQAWDMLIMWGFIS